MYENKDFKFIKSANLTIIISFCVKIIALKMSGERTDPTILNPENRTE